MFNFFKYLINKIIFFGVEEKIFEDIVKVVETKMSNIVDVPHKNEIGQMVPLFVERHWLILYHSRTQIDFHK